MWVLVGVNVVGVRAAGWVQVVTTLLKLLPLALVGVAGVMAFDASHFTVADTGLRALSTSVPAVAALTLWAFLGLESATIPAGSIQNPDVTIPRATLVGTTLAAAIYIVSTIGVMSLLPRRRAQRVDGTVRRRRTSRRRELGIAGRGRRRGHLVLRRAQRLDSARRPAAARGRARRPLPPHLRAVRRRAARRLRP